MQTSSFYTSLSGLNAAQTDLNVTSNNIANVSSTGFKASRAEFSDVISNTVYQAQNSTVGQGTRLKSISQEFSQGSVESTSRALDLTVNGSGFFVTKSASGAVSYTRDGAFSVDASDNVVDSYGNALQVLPVDALGNVTATGATATQGLHISETNGTPKQTATITATTVLPSDADLPASRAAYATSGYTFSQNDANSYNYASSTTVYDSAGNAFPATTYYVRTGQPTSGGANTSTWDAYTFVGDQQLATTTLTFDASGKLTSPSAPVAYAATQPTGAVAPLTLSVDYGSSTKQGAYAFTSTTTQDGHSTGKLDNITVGADGLVTATYSDNSSIALGKVAVANFSNPAGLHQTGNTHWTQTGNSGVAQIGAAGVDGRGEIASGELELSNVDLTSELVNLISAQRNFQANAKAIDTDKQMLQSIIQVI